MGPLKEAIKNGKPIIKEEVFRNLFPDPIVVIFKYSEAMITDMEPRYIINFIRTLTVFRITNWNVHTCIGDIFLKFVS